MKYFHIAKIIKKSRAANFIGNYLFNRCPITNYQKRKNYLIILSVSYHLKNEKIVKKQTAKKRAKIFARLIVDAFEDIVIRCL